MTCYSLSCWNWWGFCDAIEVSLRKSVNEFCECCDLWRSYDLMPDNN